MKLALAILAVVNYANATKIETEVKAADDTDCTKWIWEECSWMYYRHFCWDDDGEAEEGVIGDCGWFYWDDWNWEEFFVTCDEFYDEWYWC